MEVKPEYDIILAGGGTTACAIAGRLAAADPSIRILVVEAGPHTLDDLAHIQPARYLSHLRPESETMKFMVGRQSQDPGGRAPIVPAGQCVGGGSSVNCTSKNAIEFLTLTNTLLIAMYTRASASDYDDWEKQYDSPGWGSKDLIPLLKKVETYQVGGKDNDTHGHSGPIKVSYGGTFMQVGKDFLEVSSKYDPGRGTTEDPNGFYSCNQFARWPKWIDGETGKRSDVAHYFIYNQRSNKNLHVATGLTVQRVVFEEDRAAGIEYFSNVSGQSVATQGVKFARARRLVVVSSGTLGSSIILERSGIGAKHVLDAAGVKQLVDLPGVGENYQDHQVVFPPYIVSDECETLDGIIRNDAYETEKYREQWLLDGTGMMAHNGLDAGIKLRPNDEELKEIGPAFETTWEKYFAPAPDKPIFWMGTVALYVGDSNLVPSRKYFSMPLFLGYPSSRGHLHILSGNANTSPDFDPAFLKEKDDLALLVWAYKRSREFTRRMNCYRGEYAPNHPAYPKGSRATCDIRVEGPVAIDAPDIAYTEEDNRAIEDYIKAYVATAWHSLGTCSMKPREQGGVVDPKLNIYGVRNLKVADMSIAPANVGSNTYSTALVIGEKAAVIIGEELGIKGV